MLKLSSIIIFVLASLVISGYFAFFYRQHRHIDTKKLERSQKEFADELNLFMKNNPSINLDECVANINWLIRNDYQSDIRVKRLVHQDIKSLAEMSRLQDKLERTDPQTAQAFGDAIKTITDRSKKIRYTQDQHIRDEIILLSDMIKDNER